MFHHILSNFFFAVSCVVTDFCLLNISVCLLNFFTQKKNLPDFKNSKTRARLSTFWATFISLTHYYWFILNYTQIQESRHNAN